MNPRVRMRGALAGAVVALTFALTWSLAKVPALEDKADTAVNQVNTLKPQVQTLNDNQKKLISGLDEANRRLIALGKAPVTVPSVTPSPQPAGLTSADVRLIVTQELADQHITITQSEVSQISKAVDTLKNQMPVQVKTAATLAVAAYCADARCQPKPTPGPTGPKGDKGDNGKDAPKITDEELLATVQAALTSFCAQDSHPCQGAPGQDGKDGQNGTNGADGRSITDTDCLDDGNWLITYSDGTTDTARGPCRVVVVPTS